MLLIVDKGQPAVERSSASLWQPGFFFRKAKNNLRGKYTKIERCPVNIRVSTFFKISMETAFFDLQISLNQCSMGIFRKCLLC